MYTSFLSNTMATVTNNSSSSLIDIMCADPVEGAVYRHLFNGGSWFEAEQLHWRIVHDRTLPDLQALFTKKPTRGNIAKAQELMELLGHCAMQLVADPVATANVKTATALMATWSKPKVSSTGTNAFANLADNSDDD